MKLREKRQEPPQTKVPETVCLSCSVMYAREIIPQVDCIEGRHAMMSGESYNRWVNEPRDSQDVIGSMSLTGDRTSYFDEYRGVE
tara:strand:+ start:373 stop:627 length:255 start_codon:yes stop_codon:yes gene_type:complete